MPFTPTYKVVPCKGGYAVETISANDTKYLCTLATPEKARADRWAFDLRRAAQVETDRRTAVLSGKRRIDDD
jgi:hypothetical protein